MLWVRVKRNTPCPICGKPDWCSVAEDGSLVHCMRVESDRPCRSPKVGGWFHRLAEPLPCKLVARPRPDPVPQEDFAALAQDYYVRLFHFREDGSPLARMVSADLGLSLSSLKRLGAGWNGKAVTFPMWNGHRKVVGIRVRSQRGKWCVPGSHNGLFWPDGVLTGGSLLLLPEGPTSCAACLDLGYDAIGRPNCELGAEDLKAILKRSRRDVVIVADHDEPHWRPDGSVYYPGQEGAEKVARQIKPFCRTLKILKPPFHKDIRDWLRAGATREVVEVVIKNTRYVT